MKITNLRIYNLDKAILGLHHIQGDYSNADTCAGFLPFDEVEGVAALRVYRNKLVPIEENLIAELVNIILWQDENEICEYCSIGPNDMKLIHSLNSVQKYSFLDNILVSMDIIASEQEWKNLKTFNIIPIYGFEPYGHPYTIHMSYLHAYLITHCKALTPDLQDLIDCIKNFPYYKDLIFNK